MIYFTSDTHFGHNKEFIYKPRGFDSVEEMNECLLDNLVSTLLPDDDLYILGDVMLGDNEFGMKALNQLKCRIHIILGNHCTLAREALYKTCVNVVEVVPAARLKYKGYHFFLTHFPCLTGNLERESLKQMTLNLSGHTHSKQKFFQDLPYVYNISVDAHNNCPVSIEEIITDMQNHVRDCLSYL